MMIFCLCSAIIVGCFGIPLFLIGLNNYTSIVIKGNCEASKKVKHLLLLSGILLLLSVLLLLYPIFSNREELVRWFAYTLTLV